MAMSAASRVQFVDVKNPTLVKDEIDLDNVVLNDKQKLRLSLQCLKTKIFWQIYVMQTSSICKWSLPSTLACLYVSNFLSAVFGYYIVNTYKNFGQEIP